MTPLLPEQLDTQFMGKHPPHHGNPWMSDIHETEREKHWSYVYCMCNLCWCSLVQQCETTLRQQCDI